MIGLESKWKKIFCSIVNVRYPHAKGSGSWDPKTRLNVKVPPTTYQLQNHQEMCHRSMRHSSCLHPSAPPAATTAVRHASPPRPRKHTAAPFKALGGGGGGKLLCCLASSLFLWLPFFSAGVVIKHCDTEAFAKCSYRKSLVCNWYI
jgi:hypothetical protein